VRLPNPIDRSRRGVPGLTRSRKSEIRMNVEMNMDPDAARSQASAEPHRALSHSGAWAHLSMLEREHIDRIGDAVPGGIENVEQIYPLSPLQEGMLFHHVLSSELDTYVLSTLIELDSDESVKDLLHAVQQVMQRHEVLRSAVMWSALPMAVNVVLARVSLPVEETTITADSDLSDEIDMRMKPGWRRFELAQAPLVRLLVLKREGESKVSAILQTHHLICDHQSLKLMVQEIIAHLDQRAHELPPARTYEEYVLKTRASGSTSEAERFFKRTLATIEEPCAPFGVMDVRGVKASIVEAREHIPADLVRKIRDRSKVFGVSVARIFHAAWAIVLSRTTSSEDVVFGTVLLSSSQRGGQTEPMVGLSVNTLPLCLRMRGVTVQALMEQTHQALTELMAHEAASLSLAQRCAGLGSGLPLFTSLLNYRRDRTERSAQATQSGGIRVLTRGEAWTNYPITVTIDDAGEEGILLMAKTQQSIDPGRVLQLLQTALASIVKADPHRPAWTVSILPEAERRALLQDADTLSAAATNSQLIHGMFETWAQRTPQAVALVDGTNQLTYAELNARANQLARHLRQLGVGPEKLAALCFDRSPEMVIALLAVLKSGGAYVPLDATYPTARLLEILHDSAPVALLTHSSIQQRLGTSLTIPAVILDHAQWERSPWSLLDEQNLTAGSVGVEPFNLAYVIYTSGSTGQPKGVMVEHRNLVYFIQGLEHCIHSLQPVCERIAWNSSFAFDMAAKAWTQLTQGRSVYLLAEAIRHDGHALNEFLVKNEIEAIECTPSHLRMMLDGGLLEGRIPSLGKVLLGGEAIDQRMWSALAASESTRFFNMYGPTECSVDASCGLISGSAPHIGKVIPGARIYILDPYREPVPVGIAGEIYIGGAGVARGYLHRAALTAERFVRDPYSSQPEARMYKTGDLGRWRADGTIEYLGRNDQQVKIRGYRIELDEIQSQLIRHAEIKEAVLSVREEVAGEKRLVAYIVARDRQSVPSVEALRAHLKAVLPEFMVPSAFVMLERLPLTPNGKLDRKALPAPDVGAYATRQYEAPEGEVEEILAGIWQSLLQVQRVGRQDNFFELGGHSLLAMQVATRIQLTFAIEVPIRAVFECPVLRELSQRVEQIRRIEILSGLQSIGSEAEELLQRVTSMSDADIKEWFDSLSMERLNDPQGSVS
jgi:amino acid adenylation domain-containing protein